MGGFDLFRGNALDAYRDWPAPATIISDGAYGVRGFHGDTIGTDALPHWYRPHIAAWAAAAGPATTLWFWNTELGWASVHPVLAEFGWEYVQLIVWDKGLAHTAGEWDALRYTWRHAHGVTNVWSRRPLHGEERLKGTLRRAAPRVHNPTAASSAHLNQKPLEFMERLITAVTEPGDVVWEPFGGLCSGSVAAVTLGRRAVAAETDPAFADLAAERLRRSAAASRLPAAAMAAR